MNQNRSDSASASDHFVHSASFLRSTLNPRAAASLWLQTRNVTVWQEVHFRSRIQVVATPLDVRQAPFNSDADIVRCRRGRRGRDVGGYDGRHKRETARQQERSL